MTTFVDNVHNFFSGTVGRASQRGRSMPSPSRSTSTRPPSSSKLESLHLSSRLSIYILQFWGKWKSLRADYKSIWKAQGSTDFNTANTNCSIGMHFLWSFTPSDLEIYWSLEIYNPIHLSAANEINTSLILAVKHHFTSHQLIIVKLIISNDQERATQTKKFDVTTASSQTDAPPV